MNSLSVFTSSLSPKPLSTCFVSDEIENDVYIELLSDQKILHKGMIYIGSAPRAYNVVLSAQAEDEATVIICSAKAPDLIKIAPGRRINFIESSMPLERVFNELQAYLRRYDLQTEDHISYRQAGLWSHFLSLESPSKDAAADILSSMIDGLDPSHDRIRVLVADFDRNLASAAELSESLRKILPHATVFEYRLYLVILIAEKPGSGLSHLDCAAASSLIYDEDRLYAALDSVNGHIVISNRTSRYEKLSLMYRLSVRLLEYAPLLPYVQDNRIFPYDNYSDYVAIDYASRKFRDIFNSNDIILIINPIVVVLTRFDKENNNNLRDTLYYYLVFNGNLEKTAARLFIHKNTVSNKIKKIKELVDVDLDDGILRNQLIFSCRAIIFYEKILKERLQL